MSENDKDPRSGEFTDPTASPDWSTPSSGSEPQDPAPPAPGTPDAPQSSPTEQIPQGSQPPPPPPAPGSDSPSYDSPYQSPRGDSNPYAGSSAQPTNPYAASTPPPSSDDPYAAPQPAYDPYAATGASGSQGGYPAYNAPGQWQAPPTGYGAAPAQNTSALVLTILSGIGLVLCCQFLMLGSLILGIMGLTKNAEDPEGSRKLAKWGWVVFATSIVLSIIGIAVFISLGAAGVFDSDGYGSDSDYTY